MSFLADGSIHHRDRNLFWTPKGAQGAVWNVQTTGLNAVITQNGALASVPSSHAGASVGTVSSSRVRNSGAGYIEFRMNPIGANLGAVVRADVGLGSQVPPLAAGDSIANGLFVRRNGDIRSSAGVIGTLVYSANDVFMFAFDFTLGQIWIGQNGTWLLTGDPSTRTNPAVTGIASGLYPGFSHETGADPYGITILSTAQTCVYPLPTGFAYW